MTTTRGEENALNAVLVIEDDALQRRMAVHIARECGAGRVLEAATGFEALKRIESDAESISYALCDLDMPDMDGIELLRELGVRGFSRPVVLVSALDATLLGTVESMAREHRIHLAGVVRKPLTVETLRPLLTRLQGPVPAPRPAEIEVAPEELRAAIDEGRLEPFFQPKIELSSGGFCGAEALARWRSPAGLISPARFIGVAERSGMIFDLTRSIVSSAFAVAARWSGEAAHASVAVNLSAGFLEQRDAADWIIEAASLAGLPSSRVILEVTESMAANDLGAVLGNIARLRMRGFGLSIDDFGTGYASLDQLRRIPLTEIKIDRSFVDGASADERQRALLASCLDIARKLGVPATAEGVEAPEDLELLRRLGCARVQGYLIARPMDAAALDAWLAGRVAPN